MTSASIKTSPPNTLAEPPTAPSLATIPVIDSAPPEAAGSRRFVPALEGMRGLAALGVVVTHVAFQTGATGIPIVGRLLERFDMAVAVFFALSGFLLWRPHAAAAWNAGPAPRLGYYLRHRIARILPAYWLVVCVVLILLPSAHEPGLWVWVANILLVQVFVPLTLTDGLTQMWSLSVEVAFYALLPFLALAMRWLRGGRARLRAAVVAGGGLLCLSWNLLPIPTVAGTHADNWLPAYLPWFAVGMVLAESLHFPADSFIRRMGAKRWAMWSMAAVAFALSATNIAGVGGLEHAQDWQYVVKMGLGMAIGCGLLAPVVFGAGRYRYLTSAVGLMVGRWSYGIFIWHLAVLFLIFGACGIQPFSGDFLMVLLLTVGFSLPVAAASYALVEEPFRRLAK